MKIKIINKSTINEYSDQTEEETTQSWFYKNYNPKIQIKGGCRNKSDDDRKVLGNKSRIIDQIYTQQQDIDFTKTFVHVARQEIICMLLYFVARHDIKLKARMCK